MRVFVLGARGFPGVQGGIEKHWQELYPRLVKLGCDITVFTRTPYIPKDKRICEWKKVKFIHLWTPRNKSFEAIIHTFLGLLIAAVKRPNVLHVHGIGPSMLVPLAKLFGLRVVMTHHGSDYQRQKWNKLAKCILKAGEFLGVKFADRIIVVSKWIKSFLRERYQRKDLEFIPNGVELQMHSFGREVLKQYGLEPKKYLFTACRFVPEKGLHDLIDAYRKIKNPKFRLVIAGDADHETDYSRRLKRQAKEWGIVLTGFVHGKPLQELYSNAGLFVLPSYHEGLSLGLLEALSYGLPVLVSDIPQNKEIALRKYRYFKVGDISDLTGKIEELMEKAISEEEKNQQIEILKKEYDWNKIAQRTIEVYKSVTSGSFSPSIVGLI